MPPDLLFLSLPWLWWVICGSVQTLELFSISVGKCHLNFCRVLHWTLHISWIFLRVLYLTILACESAIIKPWIIYHYGIYKNFSIYNILFHLYNKFVRYYNAHLTSGPLISYLNYWEYDQASREKQKTKHFNQLKSVIYSTITIAPQFYSKPTYFYFRHL